MSNAVNKSSRDLFNERRERVLKLLGDISGFYKSSGEEGDAARSENFDEIKRQLENEEFSIVVVGEFSAGKSTFLNALMRERILPSFTSETTATVNFLRHIDKAPENAEGKVYYYDGGEELLPKADLKTINKYVTTEGDKVAEKIEHLDLFLKSKFLEDGVMLVDSPGLNGMAKGHAEVTERQIERSSASIFLFRADQPGSKTDFEFLKNLSRKVKSILFVVNKIDAIKVEEGDSVERVKNSLKKSYKEQFPDATKIPEIIGISAWNALRARSNEDEFKGTPEEKAQWLKESNIEEFEERLWKYLTQGEKGRTILLSPLDKMQETLGSDKKRMEEEKELLEKKADSGEIKEQIIKLEKESEDIRKKTDKSRADIESDLNTVGNDMKDMLTSELSDFSKKQISKIDSWETIDEFEDFKDNINRNLEKGISRIFENLSEEYADKVRNLLAENYRDIARQLNSKLEEINIKIPVSEKFECTVNTYNSVLEEYDKKTEDATRRIKDIEAELDKNETMEYRIKMLEQEKSKAEKDLEALKNEKSAYESNFNPPVFKISSYDSSKSKPRGGILGKVKDFFVGVPDITVTTNYDNSEEIKEYKDKFNKKIEDFDSDIKKAKNELAQLDNSKTMSSEENKTKSLNLRRKLERLIGEREKLQKSAYEKFTKENESVLRRCKNEVEDYIDKVIFNVKINFNKSIRSQNTAFTENICNMVNSRLQEEMSKLEEERKMLSSKLEASENDKSERLKFIDKRIEEMDSYLNEVIEMYFELDKMDTDILETNVD